jgi:HAD superfamily hydrolase (TIGR01549 family)
MERDFAVGFDFDHTLGIDNKLERTVALEMLAELAAEKNLTYDPAAADAAIDDTLAAYRSASQTVEIALAAFFERFAPSGSAVLDHAQKFRDLVVERAPAFIEALPGAREVLAKFDELGIRYALLTNGWSPLQEEKARLIDFRGSVYVSERIGVQKPQRAAFEMLVNHFELPPGRIFYVGDDPAADCAGAADAGLRAVWYDWEERVYPAELRAPDFIVHELAQIPALLQGQSGKAANDVE